MLAMLDRPPRPMTAPGVHETALSLLRRHLGPPARLADLAAGEGAMSLQLQQAGYQVVAIDRDPTVFRVPGVPLIASDLAGPFAAQLGPGSFDGCVALEIIEHLDSPFRFLRECRALLRPGGLLVLSSPNVESIASRLLFLWNGRLRFFTAQEQHHISPVFGWLLRRGLEEAGLALLETTYNRHAIDCGRSPKARAAALLGRALVPLVRGDKRGEIRLVAARAI
ncbi:MAG: methyltransferase domain-containing protein [Myxococcales bacterium]|nr:methyltransferase domain-containing protein [Myxococcota bacterium]MDW8281609.1 methyltransferase domain-containing protein [Myxococcales bacterium]